MTNNEEKKQRFPEDYGIVTVPRKGMIYVPSIDVYFNPGRIHSGLSWHRAHEALNAEKLRMPTIPEFIEFLKVLRDQSKYRKLYKDITSIGGEERSEWLDAYFIKDPEMSIWYHNRVEKGLICSFVCEKLTSHQSSKSTGRLDLDDWLDNHDKQGLPLFTSKYDTMYYFDQDSKERNVTYFRADEEALELACNISETCYSDTVGVFGCADGEKNKTKPKIIPQNEPPKPVCSPKRLLNLSLQM